MVDIRFVSFTNSKSSDINLDNADNTSYAKNFLEDNDVTHITKLVYSKYKIFFLGNHILANICCMKLVLAQM